MTLFPSGFDCAESVARALIHKEKVNPYEDNQFMVIKSNALHFRLIRGQLSPCIAVSDVNIEPISAFVA